LNDERKGNFKFMWEYNSDIDQKTKVPIKVKWWVKVLKAIFASGMIILTIAVMVFYQDFLMREKKDKAGAETTANESRRLGSDTGAGDSELSGASILKDFASDFIDPKAVGYGFML
jgi:hypothetical protein